ncbi:winged helix-turn-helix transcriptional regulator [Streptosporangium sp. NPDC002721]|uniref:winged helix-turn-helix transcriptional regulator n=1 Tax=Streptosporangium sp. NPDC002721 TaxID=3366188 RepID=UPI0036820CBE
MSDARPARPTAGPCALWPDDTDFIREVLERAGDKWSTLVIATLQDGPRRYTDLYRSIPGISQRMLTLTLRHLRRDGLVERTSYPEVPPRVEYALTPLGATLLSTVLALAAWAVDHHLEIRENRTRFDALTR